MEGLEAILARMDSINTAMKLAVRRTDHGRNSEIVTLREEFSTQTGELIKHLTHDPRLSQDPALMQELQSRLGTTRQLLSNHQARWQIAAISNDHHGYLTATKIVHSRIHGFLEWAQQTLASRGYEAA